MDRRDILWIALKVAGLYLIIEGVIWLPDAIVTGGPQPWLQAGIMLAVGLLLVGLRVSGSGDSRVTAIGGGLDRGDWFWLLCKGMGLWWTMSTLPQLPTTARFAVDGAVDWSVLTSVGIYLLAGLVLLFSNLVPDLVAGDGQQSLRSSTMVREAHLGEAEAGGSRKSDTAAIEVLSETPNHAVVRLPGRAAPGSVIQGDSLSALWCKSRSVRDRALLSTDAELRADAAELFDLLTKRMLHYQTVLQAKGIGLPYREIVAEHD